MEQLIEALQIFLKYGNPKYPTHCEHNVLYICGIDTQSVSQDDRVKLKELGFIYSNDFECFMSFRFGSA